MQVVTPVTLSSPVSRDADDDNILATAVAGNAFAVRALQGYLFLRRFRKLRERMIAESEKSYTDEEVFEIVS